MRVAAASIVLGAGIAAAVALGSYHQDHSASNCRTGGYGSASVPCSWTSRPGWVIPAAIMVAFVGLALASLIARRKSA